MACKRDRRGAITGCTTLYRILRFRYCDMLWFLVDGHGPLCYLGEVSGERYFF